LRRRESKVDDDQAKKMASASGQRPPPRGLRIAPINHHTVTQLTNMANELKRILNAVERAVQYQMRQDRRRARTVAEDEAEDRNPLATRFLDTVEEKMREAHEAVEAALLVAEIYESVEGTEVLPISVDEW
jgi:hypothetical protein